MAKLTLEEATLHITQGPLPSDTVSLSLTALRLVCLFVLPEHILPPGRDDDLGIVDLEALSDEELAQVVRQISALEADGVPSTLFLEDYAGRYASIFFKDIQDSGIALLEEIHHRRGERQGKLASWSRNMLGLIITGCPGDRITFGLDGVRGVARRLVAWEDLDRIDVSSDPAEELSTYRFIPRPGRTAEDLSGRIPARKARLLLAEYAFWRSLARRQAENPLWRTGLATP